MLIFRGLRKFNPGENQVLREEVAQVFGDVLADAGVFKNDEAGQAGWERFLQIL